MAGGAAVRRASSSGKTPAAQVLEACDVRARAALCVFSSCAAADSLDRSGYCVLIRHIHLDAVWQGPAAMNKSGGSKNLWLPFLLCGAPALTALWMRLLPCCRCSRQPLRARAPPSVSLLPAVVAGPVFGPDPSFSRALASSVD
jgi:hypothetical protein